MGPSRSKIGFQAGITNTELTTLSVMQSLLGFTSEARWLRHCRSHLWELFPYLPQQPGYNKRLCQLGATIGWLVGGSYPVPLGDAADHRRLQ